MKIWEYLGKNVEVSVKSGRIFQGRVKDHTSSADNDWDEGRAVDSICIDDGITLWEIYEDEIAHIEILSSVEARSGA